MGSDLEAARYHDFDDEDLEHEQDGDMGDDEVGKDGKGKKKAPRQDNIIFDRRFSDLQLCLLLQFVKTTAEFLSLFKTVGIVPVEKHVVILMDR